MISDNDRPPRSVEDQGLKQPAGKMAQSELEDRTISALRHYRESVTSAETARMRWIAAEANMDSCVIGKLRKAYEKAELEHRAQQLVLNHMIDLLGFIPALRD